VNKYKKSKAEEQFTSTQKNDKKLLKEKEEGKKSASDKIEKLKALRLARDMAVGEVEKSTETGQSEAANS